MTAPHGSLTRYTNGRCRCAECKAAKRDYERGWQARNFRAKAEYEARSMQRLRERLAAGDPTVRHGSQRTYFAGCRCEACTAKASIESMKRQRRLRAKRSRAAAS